jgi:hypothetical protein
VCLCVCVCTCRPSVCECEGGRVKPKLEDEEACKVVK